ncbi:hypothetical protein MBANPS3_009516 [Mucor bainieri]
MPFQCIICLQPLLASGDHPAVIPCGHVYHKGCLQPWVREHRNCPLCKKACTQQKILSPLYLSSDDESTQTALADTSADTQVLQVQVLQLTQEKQRVQERYNATKQELMEEKVKSQEMASDLRGATKAIRHMKQIRRVAELDDLMSSPTSTAFFNTLENYSTEDLLTQNRAMKTRLRKAHTERDEAVKKSSDLERRNLHMEKKIERLQTKLQLAEAGSAANRQAVTGALPKPKRTGNVIVLDDSDNDEDDSNDDDQTLEDDSDSPVLIAESSNHNRIYNGRGGHSSSRQPLKRFVFISMQNNAHVTLT